MGQRCSRGHKARGQVQPFRGQTLPRPKTEMLEAKDQGQRCKCSPKKKVFKKFFRRSPIHRRWRRPKPHITCYDVIKNFQTRKFFVGQRYRRIKDLKSLRLAFNPDFAKGRGLKLIVEKYKYLTLETC